MKIDFLARREPTKEQLDKAFFEGKKAGVRYFEECLINYINLISTISPPYSPHLSKEEIKKRADIVIEWLYLEGLNHPEHLGGEGKNE